MLAIDVQTEGTGSASGGTFGGSSKSRKHSSRIEFNFELTMQRFLRDLSYFDRHAVASQAVSACLEMISGFTSGSGSSSAYLPVLEHLSFLFDLFEVSLSISGLIDLCLQLLKGKTQFSCHEIANAEFSELFFRTPRSGVIVGSAQLRSESRLRHQPRPVRSGSFASLPLLSAAFAGIDSNRI